MINFFKTLNSVETVSRPSVLKLASVYFIAFIIVLILLNFSVVTNSWAFMRNKFTDYDEVLETELLMAKYQDQDPFSFVTTVTVKPEIVVNVHTAQTAQTAQTANQQIDKNSIYIPKINIRAPIIVGTSTVPNKLLKDLEKGVLMYPGSAMPGQGSTVIVGHSSSNYPWNKYSNVFSLLNRLQTGDFIYINYNDQVHVYKISDKKTGSVFSLSKADLTGDLVLSSCWPVGTDNGRIVVVADLVQ